MKALDFIFAARPMLHLPVWSIYLISLHYFYPEKSPDRYDLLILLFLNFNFAGAYFINQIHDYSSDMINKKLGFLQKGYISKREMAVGYIVVSVIAAAGSFLIDPVAGAVQVFIFILGYIYSAPPFRLKDRPFWGLISNSIAYGLSIPLCVPGNIDLWGEKTVYFPVYFFLAVSAGYLLTIIPDREGDIKTGKITAAALLPVFYVMMIAMLLLYLSLMVSIRLDYFYLMIISAISIVLFLIAMIYRKEGLILFACKTPILLMSFLAGYYYPIYLAFLLAVLIVTRLYYRKRFGMIYPKLS